MTIEVDMTPDISNSTKLGYDALFGADWNDNNHFGLQRNNITNNYLWRISNLGYDTYNFDVDDTFYNHKVLFKITGNNPSGTLSYDDTTVCTFTYPTNEKTFRIFVFNCDEIINSYGKLYRVRITESASGKELLYLIPVLDADNIACMYDLISDTFFYNAGGAGYFIAGPKV